MTFKKAYLEVTEIVDKAIFRSPGPNFATAFALVELQVQAAKWLVELETLKKEIGKLHGNEEK